MKLKKIKEFYDDGQLGKEYFIDEKGRTQGKFRFYKSDGNIFIEIYCINGIPVPKQDYFRNLINKIEND